MSWKSIVITGLLCVVASPVWAQALPEVSVVRTPGAGTTSWAVSVTPRVTDFVPNSSVAVELDFDFTGTINSFTLANNNFWNVTGTNPGNNPFTGTITETMLDQAPANDTLFVAAGSELFATATPMLLGTIVTQGTTGTLTLGGRTTQGYTTGRIAQAGINYNNITGQWPSSIVLPGDFDGNGSVGGGDFDLLLANWGVAVPPAPTGWTGAQPTAPSIGGDEFDALLGSWGQSGGAGAVAAAVPEPATIVLVSMVGMALAAVRRRG